MKITVLQENLNKGINIASRIVASKTANPIEHCLQIKTLDDERIRLATMNSAITVNYIINGKVSEQGTVLLPALYFNEFVNALPGGVSVLLSRSDKSALQLNCEKYYAKFSVRSEDAFPEIPEIKATTKFLVDIKELRTAVKLLSFSAANDKSRPMLTGINFRIEGQEATMATADGYRLSVYKIPLLEPVEKQVSVTIPATSLTDLIKIANDYDGTVDVALDSTRVIFKTPVFTVSSNIIAGTYPAYENALPKSYKMRAVTNANELYPVCRVASIFAQENSSAVDITISSGMLNLSTGKEETEQISMFGNSGAVVAETEGQGTMHLNGRYLMEIVELLKGSQIEISAENIHTPVKIIPVGIDNYMTHILMPVIKTK